MPHLTQHTRSAHAPAFYAPSPLAQRSPFVSRPRALTARRRPAIHTHPHRPPTARLGASYRRGDAAAVAAAARKAGIHLRAHLDNVSVSLFFLSEFYCYFQVKPQKNIKLTIKKNFQNETDTFELMNYLFVTTIGTQRTRSPAHRLARRTVRAACARQSRHFCAEGGRLAVGAVRRAGAAGPRGRAAVAPRRGARGAPRGVHRGGEGVRSGPDRHAAARRAVCGRRARSGGARRSVGRAARRRRRRRGAARADGAGVASPGGELWRGTRAAPREERKGEWEER